MSYLQAPGFSRGSLTDCFRWWLARRALGLSADTDWKVRHLAGREAAPAWTNAQWLLFTGLEPPSARPRCGCSRNHDAQQVADVQRQLAHILLRECSAWELETLDATATYVNMRNRLYNLAFPKDGRAR